MTGLLQPEEAKELKAAADGCLCFKARRAARAITRFYDEHFAGTKIQPTQFNMLVAIRLTEPVPLTQLADHLGLERTTFTRNLQLLERDGLAESHTGKDARSRLISLTVAGRRALKDALSHWRRAQEKARAVLGEKDFARMSEALSLSTRFNKIVKD
jgi:DNA-binding MarR family transcriptional regulator